MCILCVVQRWSRRVATMLPWLVIPLIALWAFSQLLPPRFRFEVTSPRLACVTVLLVTLFWYEILMPQLSVWRARRSARLRERRRAQALELQKLRKAATRRCRNCLTAYRDQKPGCGRFMCSYCGHISKRPVLDLPEGSGLSTGINGWICGQAWAAEGNGSWVGPVPRYWVGNDRCMAEKSYSGALLCASKLLSCFLGSIWWILRKVFRVGSSSKDSPDGDNKGSLSGENDGNCQESKGEKARRKAEEKRLARLEKEMSEEEERKQREEVARLVEERRKLRDEILEAERIHSRGSGLDGDRDRRKEAEKRRQERKKEKDKGSSKSNSDVEEFDKKTNRENEKKRELDKKNEIERRDAQKFVADKYKFHTSESGNGLKVATSKSKYFDRVTGSFLSPSKGFNGASFFGRNAQGASATVTKVNKPAVGSVDQTFSSAIRKDVYPAIHAIGKITSVADDRISKSNFDRAVGSEVRPPTPAPKKSWHQLFTRSTAVSPHDGMNTNGFSNQNEKADAHNVCMMDQRVAASYSLDSRISVQPSSFSVSPSVNGSRGGNLASHSLPAESIYSERVRNSILEEAEIFEDPCYNPDPLSLLGPVSDSLDDFPLDLGAGFVSYNKMEEPHIASKKMTAPADVSKPSPIESPISRSRISEEKRTAIGQSPSTPKSLDGASNALEQRTWQMWGTPLAQDALDMVTGPSNWLSPLGHKKSNLDDMMHPLSHNPVSSHVAVENHSIPGIHSPQNAHVDNSLNGGMFSPFGHGLNESDIWMRKNIFPQLPGDGESHVTHFPQFNLMDNAARNEMRHDASNGPEALLPFDLSPANCWSKKEWALHGLQDPGNANPAPNPGSLFSTGPDVQSVWASNQMDRIY